MKVYDHISEEPMDTKPYLNRRKKDQLEEEACERWSVKCLVLITVLVLIYVLAAEFKLINF